MSKGRSLTHLITLSQIRKPKEVMKKKKIRIKTISRSKIAIAGYYLQLAIMLPILIPFILAGSVSELIIGYWAKYKYWYLSKTTKR